MEFGSERSRNEKRKFYHERIAGFGKAERDGAKSLSNAELLAVILKSGTKDKTSLALALEVLSAHPSFQGLMGLFHLTRNQLLQIHGIGPVKAV